MRLKETVMVQLNVQLAEDVKAVAESRASRGGHRNIDAYLASLIIADASDDAPEHLQVRSQEHLVELLGEGAASPGRPMSHADWDELREQLIHNHAMPKAG